MLLAIEVYRSDPADMSSEFPTGGSGRHKFVSGRRFGAPAERFRANIIYPLVHPQLPFATTAANGGDGWEPDICTRFLREVSGSFAGRHSGEECCFAATGL
jgi:hypothetical protein